MSAGELARIHAADALLELAQGSGRRFIRAGPFSRTSLNPEQEQHGAENAACRDPPSERRGS